MVFPVFQISQRLELDTNKHVVLRFGPRLVRELYNTVNQLYLAARKVFVFSIFE